MRHRYELVAEDSERAQFLNEPLPSRKPARKPAVPWRRALLVVSVVLITCMVFAWRIFQRRPSCDTGSLGYQCQPEISHSWGQYSPYFAVPSNISADVPHGCSVTLAQVLSRHGARDPTAYKNAVYEALVERLQRDVQRFPPQYAFLKDFKYTLGADHLTAFGEQQLVNSGRTFYERYSALARDKPIFLRSAGQERVVKSAEKFAQGYHEALSQDGHSNRPGSYPYDIVIIPEGSEYNNTLSHDNCPAFDRAQSRGQIAASEWRDVFVPPIAARLNTDLPGADLSLQDVIYFMDLCPFVTVAAKDGHVSDFCALFTVDEFQQYDYYQSVGKWYGYANGNEFGPTQGIGYVQEVIARLTGQPVEDQTNVNHTLDDSNTTFPLDGDHVLFADFSHDNDMVSIFAALGLYNDTTPLPTTKWRSTEQSAGFSTSWTVPFGARAYMEKLQCEDQPDQEMVRILVNGRVMPLTTCGGDTLGRCNMSAFIESLSFAASGGDWDRC